MCKDSFVRDNEKCAALARIIQERLGFKLKLIQSQDDTQQWIAKFSFHRSEMEGNYFVTISYNIEEDSFTCRLKIWWEFFCQNILLHLLCILSFAVCDMKPKSKRFSDMKILLAKTNDVTGLLYWCWKSFMSFHWAVKHTYSSESYMIKRYIFCEHSFNHMNS